MNLVICNDNLGFVTKIEHKTNELITGFMRL